MLEWDLSGFPGKARLLRVYTREKGLPQFYRAWMEEYGACQQAEWNGTAKLFLSEAVLLA